MEAGLDRMQLQLRDLALETEEQPAIDRRWIINTVVIADQTAAESAEVEELVPVGAVAGEPRDVIGEYDPDIAESNPADQLGEADPPARRAGGLAQVAIDDVDRGLRPAADDRLLPEVILQPQALLVADDLLRGGLADVDHGPPIQVGRRDEVGAGHGTPPAERSRWLRGWVAGPLPGLASRRSEARLRMAPSSRPEGRGSAGRQRP